MRNTPFVDFIISFAIIIQEKWSYEKARFLRETHRYAEHLRELGMTNVTHQMLDWRFWYGAPWVMTKLVKATK